MSMSWRANELDFMYIKRKTIKRLHQDRKNNYGSLEIYIFFFDEFSSYLPLKNKPINGSKRESGHKTISQRTDVMVLDLHRNNERL